MRTLSRLHGLFNVAGGLWPVVHLRSFEAVSGPKVDRWLVRTVGGMMAVNGLVQLSADDEHALTASRRLGIGTALWLAAIDLRYALTGRISKVYLIDAALELGWVAAWGATLRTARSPRRCRTAVGAATARSGDRPSAEARGVVGGRSRTRTCDLTRVKRAL